MADKPYPPVYLWPLMAAASAGRFMAATIDEFAGRAVSEDEQREPEPEWTTKNRVALDLPTMRLRDFFVGSKESRTLVCAPLALHSPVVVDFAPEHSVVERLLRSTGGAVYATDWRSANADMRFFSIDTYLADINVAVDEIGAPLNLVGACQGGWMALLYAARFPAKVRRLAIAGSPIDVEAGASALSRLASTVPLDTFREIVHLGSGRMLGHRLREVWTSPRPSRADVRALLELDPNMSDEEPDAVENRFRQWDEWTLDLPGTYYLQAVEWLFKENRLVKGRFEALGRPIDLKSVHGPLFLLAGIHDDLVAPDQVFAAARHVGTPRERIVIAREPCGHLGLFMGRRTVARAWSRIGDWLAEEVG